MASYQNICDCPDPPGGRIVCAADQLAICRVKNEKILSGCFGPPFSIPNFGGLSAPDRLRYLNWALIQITGDRRGSQQALTYDDMNILQSNLYDDPKTGERISFRLPPMLRFP